MEHETALSDLDATRERAQLLESEKEYLRVELMRQQKETQRAFEQVRLSMPRFRVYAYIQTHTHILSESLASTRLTSESKQFFIIMSQNMCRGSAA